MLWSRKQRELLVELNELKAAATANKHYALLQKSHDGILYYLIFDHEGRKVGFIKADAKNFEAAQEKFSRLTILFTGAYNLDDYSIEYYFKQFA